MAYSKVGKEFKGGHHSVNHSAEEYVRGDHHTNATEEFFGIFKRGINGCYQHCGKQHLHGYLANSTSSPGHARGRMSG